MRERIGPVNINLLIVFAATLIGLFFQWNIMEVAIFTLFVLTVMKPIKSVFFFAGYFFFLINMTILLIFKYKDIAEQFAIYAYYFLWMAVIMIFFEIRNKKKQSDVREI